MGPDTTGDSFGGGGRKNPTQRLSFALRSKLGMGLRASILWLSGPLGSSLSPLQSLKMTS